MSGCLRVSDGVVRGVHGHIVRLTAGRILSGQLAEGHTVDVPSLQADLAFHQALLAATNNELLAKLEVFVKTGLADRDRLVHLARPPGDPVPSHRRVVDKLRARDDFTEACAG